VADTKGINVIDSPITAKIKSYALNQLDSDLIGIANIERFEHAPLKMSPQGIMPTAKSVIVMALHHPDANIELDGVNHPQDEGGPYRIQGVMNERLDEMSYRMANYIESQGFTAVPITSSNIWRYKGYKDLKEQFAPDVSHIHMAVAAGLADFGISGLAITPEYGARNRFVTIITDAELTATPLLEPGSVCDNCKLCVKHCMTNALDKEIDGWNIVKIEDKEYRYLNKNLWRCSWAEHFQLDLDLDLPEKVDEAAIVHVAECHGTRGQEMGSCLRHCVPKPLRYFDREYTNAPRRKKLFVPDEKVIDRRVLDILRADGDRHQIEAVLISDADDLNQMGIDITKYLPDGKTAIIVGIQTAKPYADDLALDPPISPEYGRTVEYRTFQAVYDMSRSLERLGYSALTLSKFPETKLVSQVKNLEKGKRLAAQVILTSAPFESTGLILPEKTAATKKSATALSKELKQALSETEVDMVGIAPASLLSTIAEQLKPSYDGEKTFAAKDRADRFHKYDAEIIEKTNKVSAPDDFVKGAKSVIVLGLRMPKGSLETVARNDAEAVGSLMLSTFESNRQLKVLGLKTCKMLENAGYSAEYTMDLTGTASFNNGPQGERNDVFSNRFSAVAAGLARISKCGFPVTRNHGTNIRFVSIVTDAPLDYDRIIQDSDIIEKCDSCDRCLKACQTNAFGEQIKVNAGDVAEKFHTIKRANCDWAKRHSLVGASGNVFQGWDVDVAVPDVITKENLKEAMENIPAVIKFRPCNMELCSIACPYTRTQ
jgi:epoxyqueuosine reductase QueG